MQENEKSTVVTLVITDGVFGNQCVDSAAYVKKLKENMANSTTRDITLVSVTGNRGISDLDNTITALDLDTKNKTQFVQSLENNSHLFDEILIIRHVDDTFLSGTRIAATELNKPFFMYGYNRKEK